MKIAALARHPVKGLSAEPLDEAVLTTGDHFPGDRLFAIENGPSGFDPADPRWAPKIRYVMLMRDERLAEFETRYDDATTTLIVSQDGEEATRGDLSTPEGRAEIAAFFALLRRDDSHGPTRVLSAPAGFRFTDSTKGFVSLINRASLDDLGRMVGRAIDPRRMRGNILVDGLDAWEEFGLVGKTLALGEARLVVTHRIQRCAATNVDPTTARRDMEIPHWLMEHCGHMDCGVYARIARGGRIAVGDEIALAQGDLIAS
ncbi:MAG: MOSC domain-containing protein [Rhodoblastus sp.]|nr:MAG: MOSC domain-containing protein [Rhodoblastus sp.]